MTSTSTELDDRSNQHVRQFRLTDVHVGDYVESMRCNGGLAWHAVRRTDETSVI